MNHWQPEVEMINGHPGTQPKVKNVKIFRLESIPRMSEDIITSWKFPASALVPYSSVVLG